MILRVFLILIVAVWKFTTVHGQCEPHIPVPNNGLPSEYFLHFSDSSVQIDSASRNGNVFVATLNGYSDWRLCIQMDTSLIAYKIDPGYTFDPYEFEIRKMKVDNIEDSVIYLAWSDYDVGSGSGSIVHCKSFWAMDGSRCYARIVDKSTFVLKVKDWENNHVSRTEEDFYCKATFSRFGIRVTTNNVCNYTFDFPENARESSINNVSRVQPGFYFFDGKNWVLRDD